MMMVMMRGSERELKGVRGRDDDDVRGCEIGSKRELKGVRGMGGMMMRE